MTDGSVKSYHDGIKRFRSGQAASLDLDLPYHLESPAFAPLRCTVFPPQPRCLSSPCASVGRRAAGRAGARGEAGPAPVRGARVTRGCVWPRRCVWLPFLDTLVCSACGLQALQEIEPRQRPTGLLEQPTIAQSAYIDH